MKTFSHDPTFVDSRLAPVVNLYDRNRYRRDSIEKPSSFASVAFLQEE